MAIRTLALLVFVLAAAPASAQEAAAPLPYELQGPLSAAVFRRWHPGVPGTPSRKLYEVPGLEAEVLGPGDLAGLQEVDGKQQHLRNSGRKQPNGMLVELRAYPRTLLSWSRLAAVGTGIHYWYSSRPPAKAAVSAAILGAEGASLAVGGTF